LVTIAETVENGSTCFPALVGLRTLKCVGVKLDNSSTDVTENYYAGKDAFLIVLDSFLGTLAKPVSFEQL